SFELMAQSSKDASRAREACHVLAVAAGARGMVGGQGLDLQAEGRRSSPRALRRIHAGKTGALITASLECGAILAGADAKKRTALRRFGDHIGLAFQVADDILNVEGDQAKLGKKTGSDLAKAKTTYPGVFGLEKSKKIAKKELENALRCLKPFGKKAEPLARLARFVVERDH
ncbi:MAG: polyprenyl synthetase family protein, partial [candidate division FCPU426 bacterium]